MILVHQEEGETGEVSVAVPVEIEAEAAAVDAAAEAAATTVIYAAVVAVGGIAADDADDVSFVAGNDQV